MHDYYFISSPLHFFITCNLAIAHPEHPATAIIMAKNPRLADQFVKALSGSEHIFGQVIAMPDNPALGKLTQRRQKCRRLAELFNNPQDCRLLTGNDRRVEFQYAMHCATQQGGQVEGVYLDDGAVTYTGHKSMQNLAHRYLDPWLKKLVYGWWWREPRTIGSSDWIQSAYVAFPDNVHPLLANKQRHAIDPNGFKHPDFQQIVARLLGDGAKWQTTLKPVRVMLTLPHENLYRHNTAPLKTAFEQALKTVPADQIAIKMHPRSQDDAATAALFPGTLQVDKTLGMEVLLALLNEQCLVLGDVSSTLLTTRWLRPDLKVAALQMGSIPENLATLYTQLDIPIVDPELLSV